MIFEATHHSSAAVVPANTYDDTPAENPPQVTVFLCIHVYDSNAPEHIRAVLDHVIAVR